MKIRLVIAVAFAVVFLSACKKEDNKVIYTEPTTPIVEKETEPPTEEIIESVHPTEEMTESVPTEIEDKVIYDAICLELGYEKGHELTKEDYESVTYLAIWEGNVETISGISLLKNLEELHIGPGSITDIGELASIESLRTLNINNNYILTIPDFSKTNLTDLYLSGNMITDLSPLANIDSLSHIDVGDNFISSIEPLKDNENINFFSINNNCIMDYEVIADNASMIKALEEGSQISYADCVATNQRAKEIVKDIMDLSESEKERYIYQYVLDNVEYEIVSGPMVPFGYTGLMTGKGVCGDYAEVFCLLAVSAGLECYVCNSETHAWNIVNVDGKYYHCDATWDDTDVEWLYFNVSGEEISQDSDHVYDVNRYPN